MEEDDDFIRFAKANLGAENVKKEIEEAVRKGGPGGLAGVLQEKNESWKNVPLNIAVIGASGTGKSCFINASRSITAEDEGGAAVGIVETTTEPKPYAHPENGLIIYWDLPGCGTPGFANHDDYLKKIEFERYDFYLLLSANRFTADDQWLAKTIRDAKKNFFYVRTQSDIDVEKHRKAYPRTWAEKPVKEILDLVRNDIIHKLGLSPEEQCNVFLINSYEVDKLDFVELQRKILNSLPKLKREAYLFSLNVMGTLSKTILKEKVEALRGYTWKTGLISGAVAIIPVPGVSIVADIALILTQSIFYMRQLGLDPISLQAAANAHAVKLEDLQEALTKYMPLVLTKEFLLGLLTTVARPLMVGQAAEEVLKFFPLIGSCIAPPLSFALTWRTLAAVLTKMEEAANNIIDICVAKERQKAEN
ncbi:interferon-inducible GTPase 5-like [Paramacrobiotus metropolitanus]|uniref:interferon-inducible GTPase 5-like n=1 Tax=Paramacrobiotus metropolitanus TaxID=2943436 RepID=UPI00244657FA|nr:interferon-inducible GTPase 5-like [Paramacrobiotus metropolitanus]